MREETVTKLYGVVGLIGIAAGIVGFIYFLSFLGIVPPIPSPLSDGSPKIQNSTGPNYVDSISVEEKAKQGPKLVVPVDPDEGVVSDIVLVNSSGARIVQKNLGYTRPAVASIDFTGGDPEASWEPNNPYTLRINGSSGVQRLRFRLPSAAK